MPNRIVSPGVFTREKDLSFLPLAIEEIGAAVVGPTVRGPAMVPTPISTYSEYLRIYGDVFSSGSGAQEKEYKYLTSYAVQEYLRWGKVITVVRILAGNYAAASSYVAASESLITNTASAAGSSFRLFARTEGDIMNSGTPGASLYGTGSKGDETSNGALRSGSRYNIRWEIDSVSEDRGTFNLFIRRGDDINTRKVILEQFNGLSLDPNTSNYISKVIGDQVTSLRYDTDGSPYLQLTGSYPNRSRYVRVQVLKDTLNYLNSNGTIRDGALSGSLPLEVSGTFANGSDGNVSHPRAMYNDIWNLNSQGFNLASASYGKTAYEDAIDLLANQDEYDINLLVTPGLIDGLNDHAKIVTRALTMCEDRGDVFYMIDPTYFGSTVGQAQQSAEARNSSYGGMYYPWVQFPDADLGRNVWLPPSAVLPGVYAFNDYAQAEWYAPAGLNRGGIDLAVQAERKLTHADRDKLYVRNVNPIATFPKHGVVVWGQKTLQKKASALDRINVRRLLIAAKKYIASTAKYLVFEQNTEQTRARFLQITEPWFEDVRRRQGLYDFKIIVDASNNTPDVVDRNELRAAIYLKPAKTAEFIIVDFLVMNTGAIFPGDAVEE